MIRRQFLSLVAAPLLPTREELGRYQQKLEKTLFENILPFWHPRTIDSAGGYLLNHDGAGKALGRGPRALVTQARMVWFYARLARFGHEPKAMLEAAAHGVKFLRETMWDARHGGFYWEVDAAGKPAKSNKHLYGQAFALYALAEYAQAARKKDALEFALKVFQLLEQRAHDPVHGGYVEYFLPDWSTPPVNEPIYLGGGGPGLKLMNTHLHLMEALTTLHEASRNGAVRERLLELIGIETSAVVRKHVAACTDKHDRDWTPRLEGDFATVSYGHDLENIWLVAEACRSAGVPVSPYTDLFRESFAYCRRNGFDEAKGGFFYTGPLGKAAADHTKSWWVQAEALVSALEMYRLTGRTDYFEVFRKTWKHCEEEQMDWQNGEWHAAIDASGKPRGVKAGPWKAAYHNGRAMMECLLRLKALQAQSSW